MTSLEMTKEIVKILDNKKAADIKAIRVKELTSIGDYFVIASATSEPHAKALSDEVEEKLSSFGVEPRRVEGYNSATWVLLDYYDVLVHIFTGETRQFYSLDRLWADGEPVDISAITAE
ncbi:MAG: ribosome silencing factor [Oscillospiraceae bacterium]|nr:ribosome silencing factor [Oscillospiraceae bacterium]